MNTFFKSSTTSNPMAGTTNPTPTFGMNPTNIMGLGSSTSGMGGNAVNKGVLGTGMGGITNAPSFGSTNPQLFQQPSATSNQPNLGLSTQPQQVSSGLFGTTKPNTSFGGAQATGFGFQGQTITGYGQQPTTQQIQQGSSNINYTNPQFIQNISPAFSLLPTNYLKYDKISTLQDDIKKLIGKIELDLKNNEIYQDYADNMFKNLNENYKVISSEGVKVVKFCKLINSKNSKIKFILETLKIEIDQQCELLKKERKNYHILEQHPTFKITIPNEYFFNLTTEIEEKMSLQIQQISDLEALINLYYRKEYGSFKVNSDIVEELIKELYNSLIGLVSEAARINEYVTSLKMNYIEMMKFNYGWKELEIENRIRAHMSSGEEMENIYYR